MPDLEIFVTRSARKEIESLDTALIRRVLEAIESLARTPMARGAKKLQGGDDLWRIRVGEYRIIYEIFVKAHRIDVIAVRHRGDAYK